MLGIPYSRSGSVGSERGQRKLGGMAKNQSTCPSLIRDGNLMPGGRSREVPPASQKGFCDYWTIISKAGLNVERLKSESPTTNSWFDVAQVLARQCADWKEFSSRFVDAVGIPLKKKQPTAPFCTGDYTPPRRTVLF
jgi:hypothetical protein